MWLRSSIFWTFAAGGHLNQLGIKLAEDGDKIVLRRHHLANVLVRHRHFSKSGADQRHATISQETIHVFPIEFLVGGFAAHGATGSVRCGVVRSELRGLTSAAAVECEGLRVSAARGLAFSSPFNCRFAGIAPDS